MLFGKISIINYFSTYVILASNSFWGHQHYSSTMIHVSCDASSGTAEGSAKIMAQSGNAKRNFYYYIDSSEKVMYLYAYVTGGNAYG
jgi:hypothetical protein